LAAFHEQLSRFTDAEITAARMADVKTRTTTLGRPDKNTMKRWRSGKRPRSRSDVRAFEENLRATMQAALDGLGGTERRNEVRRLADRGLLDPDGRVCPGLVAAYDEGGQQHAGDRALVDRVLGIVDHRRRAAVVGEIAQEHHRRMPSTRRELSMDIELGYLTANARKVYVNLTWRGQVPAEATVEIAHTGAKLAKAYERDACIFRELAELDEDAFDEAADALVDHRPVLRFPENDGETFRAEPTGADGSLTYAFANEAAGDRLVQLDVCFPYAVAMAHYPVVFGSYAVVGSARVSLKVPGDYAQPRAVAYGAIPMVEIPDPMGRRELRIKLGVDDAVMAPGSGVHLYWGSLEGGAA
jgi:hypothetical protein